MRVLLAVLVVFVGCVEASQETPDATTGPCTAELQQHLLEPAGSGPIEIERRPGAAVTFSVEHALKTSCTAEPDIAWSFGDAVETVGHTLTLHGCDSLLIGSDPKQLVLTVTVAVEEISLSASWSVVVVGAQQGCVDLPEWRTHAELPYEVTENSAVGVGNTVVIAGGFVGINAPADAWQYDTAGDSWSKIAPLPKSGYHHASLVELDGVVYMVAALSSGLGFEPTADVLSWKPGDDSWKPRALAPAPRGAAGAAAIGSRIYVAGGLSDTGITGSLVRYDPHTDEWDASLPPMKLAREHVAACALDGQLHIFGGRIGGLNNQDAHEVYDPQTNAWSDAEPLPTPRSGIAAAVLNGRCHVFGGEQTSGTFDEHEAWSADAGWETLPPMPTARHGLGAATVGSRIYVVGGGPQPSLTFSSANESFGL